VRIDKLAERQNVLEHTIAFPRIRYVTGIYFCQEQSPGGRCPKACRLCNINKITRSLFKTIAQSHHRLPFIQLSSRLAGPEVLRGSIHRWESHAFAGYLLAQYEIRHMQITRRPWRSSTGQPALDPPPRCHAQAVRPGKIREAVRVTLILTTCSWPALVIPPSSLKMCDQQGRLTEPLVRLFHDYSRQYFSLTRLPQAATDPLSLPDALAFKQPQPCLIDPRTSKSRCHNV